MIGALLVACVTLVSVSNHRLISPALVGVAINYALNVTDALNGLLQTFTNSEINLVALERIDAYRALPPEDSAVDAPGTADGSVEWPEKGEIAFDSVEMRYREELPLVLKGVTFTVPGGSSCGIVGRTGAGKSSLLVAVLRLAPCEKGVIRIDGVDVSTLSLHTLRHALALIPQDPVLFSGTLRYNLDPLGEYADSKLWELLERVNLADLVRERGPDDKLAADVTGGGENYSVGQRQLLCLARALLRRTKIMLLDEATASVDLATDGVIQATLTEQLAERQATLMCIAHRIHTILTYDRVIVMEHGKVAEMGLVKDLVDDKSSQFAALAAASG
jgi:ATP-binding cassette subfamily C (CFTR/MRP) protein 1